MVPPRLSPARLCTRALIPFGHQADDRVGAGPELGRRGAVQAGASRAASMHASCMPKQMPRNGRCLAGVGDRRDLALHAALAEAARDQHRVHAMQAVGMVGVSEFLGVDPTQADPHVVGDAAVDQGLVQRFVGVEQPGVLAHHRDRDLAFRPMQPMDDSASAQVGRALVRQAERLRSWVSRPCSW